MKRDEGRREGERAEAKTLKILKKYILSIFFTCLKCDEIRWLKRHYLTRREMDKVGNEAMGI